ncbi:MAG: hypothetical protein QOJ07_1374 [Thermoleophilaceae bacterium]|nr:hypothetical protein [Thermoleophilaceae bacterium]
MTIHFPQSHFSTPPMTAKAAAPVSWRRMSSVGLGALAAVTASTLFSIGLVLQAAAARTVSADSALRIGILLQVARRPRWLLGGLVIVIGFGFHVTALTAAPITVVQPALAAGLLVLIGVGIRDPGERAGVREIAGVAGIIVGVVAVTFTAPGRATSTGSSESVALALGTLGVAILIPHSLAIFRKNHGGEASLLATFSAGASYAMTGLTTKLFSDHLAAGEWVSALPWLALTGAVAALALVDQTSALQERSIVEVGPIVYVIPVVVPVLLAPALVGEGWGAAPHGVAPLVLSLVVVCVAAAALGGSSAAARAAAGGRS